MAPRNEACTFLSFIDFQRLAYFWRPEEHPCKVLELLKAKEYQTVLDMVQSGEVAPQEPLPGMSASLLRLAMQKDFRSTPVLADIVILLDAMAARGAALDEDDFRSACSSGVPGLLRECLARGSKVTANSLHELIRRSGIGNSNIDQVRESVQVLLEARAELDGLGSAREAQRETPLTAAAQEMGGNSLALMRCLLDHRADPCGVEGSQAPLHAHLSKWGNEKGIRLLVERRADVNQRDALGRTPIHTALSGHANLELANVLKSLGADPMAKDREGLRPSEIVLRNLNAPLKAAALEDRPMNEEEQRWQKALEHPVAKMFYQQSRRVNWVLTRSPCDDLSDEESDCEGGSTKVQAKIADLLNGHKPKTIVLSLPLTRYSELWNDLVVPCSDDFTLKDLLTQIYEFYKAPFDETQLRRIREHFGQGDLGDAFGYIERNVQPGEAGENPAKRQRVPRVDLRGDSIYFEGFEKCKYFEDEKKLCGGMCLGS